MAPLTKRERSIAAKFLATLTPSELFAEFLAALRKTPRRTLPDLFAAHDSLGEQAKTLYDHKDAVLKKLVRAWKKGKRTPVDPEHYLDIEDAFRGQTKAFAPGFAHRYKLKLRKLVDVD